MESVLTELLIILVLLVANGLFSMSELAIVSARKARLQTRAEQGDLKASAALRLAEAPDDFMATVQVGITLVGILAGAFGGARIAEKLTPWLSQIPALAPYAQSLAFGLGVLVNTNLSRVIGELAPKRLALNHAEGIARAVARPMGWLARITAPIVRLLSGSTNLLLRLFGVKPSNEPEITEDEIRILVRQGAQAGVVEAAEQKMVENIFRLGDRRVHTLMTPCPDVIWLDVSATAEDILQELRESGFSRYPVAEESVDNILGFVRAKDLLAELLAGRPPDLKAILRRPLFVPESMPIWKVLEQFKQTGTHIAVAVDEHGGTQGLITHHDILEGIVGEIERPANAEEMSIVQREDGSWLLDGSVSVHDLKELLAMPVLPGETTGEYHTLSGFVMFQMGRIPAPADSFEFGAWRFEVLDMDRHRIDKVLVSRADS
ncbi:MAG: hemolysin family protein [Acidobacteriota bacterium]